jgi:hypothetical protein
VARETSVLLSLGVVVAWLLFYAAILFATRHRPLPPERSNVDPQSPAVVALLVSDFEARDEVAEATALDLAARRFLEYHDRTLARGPAYPTGLSELEQMIYDRASQGWGRSPAKGWASATVNAAQREARIAGLSRQRFDLRLLLWLGGSGLLAAGVVAGSIRWATGNSAGYLAGLLLMVMFAGLIATGQRTQHTAAGRVAAAHWLALRDAPPSAGYAVALGVHEGLSDGRTLVWSHGRRARVRYPSGWDRYGRSPVDLLRQAAQRLVVGGALIYFWPIAPVLVIGGYLVLRGLYLLVRNVIDLLFGDSFSGTVQRVEPWRGPLRELFVWRVPHVAYCVIDDGHSSVLTAWALPSELERPEVGDVVRVKVRRWSRRIAALALVESKTWHSSSSEDRSPV